MIGLPLVPAPDMIIDVGFINYSSACMEPFTCSYRQYKPKWCCKNTHLTHSQRTSGSQACCNSWSGNMW